MAYVVQGTSVGGTTVVERESASAAYDTAIEMQHARYADVTIRDPSGEPIALGRQDDASPGCLPGLARFLSQG